MTYQRVYGGRGPEALKVLTAFPIPPGKEPPQTPLSRLKNQFVDELKKGLLGERVFLFGHEVDHDAILIPQVVLTPEAAEAFASEGELFVPTIVIYAPGFQIANPEGPLVFSPFEERREVPEETERLLVSPLPEGATPKTQVKLEMGKIIPAIKTAIFPPMYEDAWGTLFEYDPQYGSWARRQIDWNNPRKALLIVVDKDAKPTERVKLGSMSLPAKWQTLVNKGKLKPDQAQEKQTSPTIQRKPEISPQAKELADSTDSQLAMESIQSVIGLFPLYQGPATNISKDTRVAFLSPDQESSKRKRATAAYINPNHESRGEIRFTFHLPRENVSSFLELCRESASENSLIEALTSETRGDDQLFIDVSLSADQLQLVAKNARWDVVNQEHIEDPCSYPVPLFLFAQILYSLEGHSLSNSHKVASETARPANRPSMRETRGPNSEPVVIFQAGISQPSSPELRPPLPPSDRPKSKFERKARQRAQKKKGKGKK